MQGDTWKAVFAGKENVGIALIILQHDIVGRSLGFDQALFQLYESGYITYEDALRNADSINDLRLKIKLQGKDAKNLDLMQEVSGIKMQEDDDEKNRHRLR